MQIKKKKIDKAGGGLAASFPIEIFKALSDPNRLAVLARFYKKKEMNVGEVASCCPTHLSVISRHLLILKNAGILQMEKRGKEVFYRLNAGEMADQFRRMANLIQSMEK